MLYNMVMEDVFGLGGRAETMNNDLLLDGNPLFLPNMLESQMRLTPEDLQDVLKKYFTMKNVLTLSIVPRGSKNKGIVFE
jgi:predicted Zn-dependent peptidase